MSRPAVPLAGVQSEDDDAASADSSSSDEDSLYPVLLTLCLMMAWQLSATPLRPSAVFLAYMGSQDWDSLLLGDNALIWMQAQSGRVQHGGWGREFVRVREEWVRERSRHWWQSTVPAWSAPRFKKFFRITRRCSRRPCRHLRRQLGVLLQQARARPPAAAQR
jgi:hypothetical protein